MKWAFARNDFFEEEKAVLQLSDMAIQRGYGVFDFFRTSKNKPLFLDDHLDRFFNSARELFITLPLEREALINIIHRLIAKNNIPESGIRITATGGYTTDNYSAGEGNIIIQQQELTLPAEEKFLSGIKIITHDYLRDLPQVKSINYLMGVWLQQKVKAHKADDVLYVHDNLITEFPRSNIFIVTQQRELTTPANKVLAGITRKKLLEVAPAVVPTYVRDISVDELKNAAEVFMTSTTKRLLPVTEIDGLKIGNGSPGTITKLLYNRFIEFENAYLSAL